MPKRRRGPRARSRPRPHVGFDLLVGRALAGIPSPFRECLTEVAIVIDDDRIHEHLVDRAVSSVH
jgi:predicted Zn-dependent protease with MMP-like domain